MYEHAFLASVCSIGASIRDDLPCKSSSLLGTKLHQANRGQLVAPILHPSTTGLPFGAYLEVTESSSRSSQQQQAHHQQLELGLSDADAQASAAVVQLCFVLAGQGLLCTSSQPPTPIAAGHSILSAPTASSLQLPYDAADGEQPGRQAGDAPLPLMVLKLLLPSALLRGRSMCDPQDLEAVSSALPPVSLPAVGEITAELLAAMHTTSSSSKPQQPGSISDAPTHSSTSSSYTSSSTNGMATSSDAASSPSSTDSISVSSSYEDADLSSVHSRSLDEVAAYQLPNQNNKLALVFGPSTHGVSLTFGLEVFPPGHVTPAHLHHQAHELFFVLSGAGEAICEEQRFDVGPGDCVVFPPGVMHGIDNPHQQDKLFCLQMMLPNEDFSEFVESGMKLGRLDDAELCHLFALHC